jgi:hypothetical protein
MHYQRWVKYGDPDLGRRHLRSEVRRLRDFPTPTPQPTPCRLWQGPLTNGYGQRARPSGSNQQKTIHRWVMELALGKTIRPDEVVMHLCDQKLCFRFDHLRVGTRTDNIADCVAKGRNKVPPPRHGEAHPNSKLTEDAVHTIRRRLAGGDHVDDISKDFHVSSSTIHYIRRGRAWKWLLTPGL